MDKDKKNSTEAHPVRFRLRPAQTVLLGFLVIILFGTFLLSLPISSKSREWTNFIDAFFTSASSVCVTGLSTLSTSVHFSIFGQVVILLLIQIGGLGFMTATTFVMLIIRKKISFKDRLTIQDSLSRDTSKGIVRLVRSILILTFSVEAAGGLVLLPFFCADNGAIGVWQAFFTSVSAFCNAGFDLFAGAAGEHISLTAYGSNAVVCLTVCFLIIAGGIGFSVIADVYASKGRLKKLSVHTKVVLSFSAVLIVFGTAVFMLLEYNNPSTLGGGGFFNKLLKAFFQSVTSRTAGFFTIEQSALHPAGKAIFGIMMFIGASPGSTGGGIKTTTFLLIVMAVVSVMKGRDDVVLFKHKVGFKNIYKALSVFVLGITLILFLAIFILIAEYDNAALNGLGLYSFSNVLFDAVSTFSTTGLSTGITPHLSAASKLVTVVVMFAGRVGLINFGVALFVDKESSLIKYPECNIGIG